MDPHNHLSLGHALQLRGHRDPWPELRRRVGSALAADLADRVERLSHADDRLRLDRLIELGEPPGEGEFRFPMTVWRVSGAHREIRPGDAVLLTTAGAARTAASLQLVHPSDIFRHGEQWHYLPFAWRRRAAGTGEYLATLTGDQRLMLGDGEMARLRSFARELDRLQSRVTALFDHEACGGCHGPAHWARVALHARAVARALGVDPLVPHVFAMVHDCLREDEGDDPGHGPRAARFVGQERDGLFAFLDDQEIDDLAHACRLHSSGHVDGESIVQACWDGDRLDLARPGVGIRPNPRYLCTAYAKRSEVIAGACAMAKIKSIPDEPELEEPAVDRERET